MRTKIFLQTGRMLYYKGACMRPLLAIRPAVVLGGDAQVLLRGGAVVLRAVGAGVDVSRLHGGTPCGDRLNPVPSGKI